MDQVRALVASSLSDAEVRNALRAMLGITAGAPQAPIDPGSGRGQCLHINDWWKNADRARTEYENRYLGGNHLQQVDSPHLSDDDPRSINYRGDVDGRHHNGKPITPFRI